MSYENIDTKTLLACERQDTREQEELGLAIEDALADLYGRAEVVARDLVKLNAIARTTYRSDRRMNDEDAIKHFMARLRDTVEDGLSEDASDALQAYRDAGR